MLRALDNPVVHPWACQPLPVRPEIEEHRFSIASVRELPTLPQPAAVPDPPQEPAR